MKISTIESFLKRPEVFTWVHDDYVDLPDDLADELVSKGTREDGFEFLLNALHTQAYCETFATDLVKALQSGQLLDIAFFHERAIDALRGYARYIVDANADIAIAAYKKFQREYEEGEIQNAKILEFKPF
jgi:hypothetical protein